jgi:hypothetical protein
LRSGEAGLIECSLLPCFEALRESIPGDGGLVSAQGSDGHEEAYGAGFLFLPKKLILSLASTLPFFLCPSELTLSRLEEPGVTGLPGTEVAAVDAGTADGAVENEGAPSRIASIGGWLELDFLVWVFAQLGCSSCADSGGV